MNAHESYVGLETARLLKQAGFDWEVNSRWQDWCTKDWFLSTDLPYYEDTNGESNDHGFSAPSIAVAQRWLREVKNMNIGVLYDKERKWNFDCVFDMDKDITYDNYYYEKYFNTYESALEAGIKKCLEIILKKNK